MHLLYFCYYIKKGVSKMKKINRIISIITSLSLTFVSSVYIVSAKKETIQTTQSSSSNQSKPANKTPVIIKSTPPKKAS